MKKVNETTQDQDELEKTLGDHDESLKAGQEFITSHWRALKQETKDILVDYGSYSTRGVRSKLYDDGFGLEYHIGILSRCVKCKLPSRRDFKSSIPPHEAFIPYDAWRDDIFSACDDILYSQFHDPCFLRLALDAIVINQIATLLPCLPPFKEKNSFFLGLFNLLAIMGGGLLLFLITISSPYFLGLTFVSAAKGDIGTTVFSLYVLGIGIWIYKSLKNIPDEESKKSQYEKNYDAWNGLRWRGTSLWGGYGLVTSFSTGAGARFSFQEMAKKE